MLVPNDPRKQMIQPIHSTHIGADGCLRRARESIYWPGMTRYIKYHTAQCDVCRSFDNKQSKETLRSHEVPNRPWAKVGVDIFTFNERNYLITVDYFSGFWEIDLLENVKAKTVIRKMKSQFARYGVPDVCMSDNGPQFVSEEYHKFSKSWKFQRITQWCLNYFEFVLE